jgi:hypothetical protein
MTENRQKVRKGEGEQGARYKGNRLQATSNRLASHEEQGTSRNLFTYLLFPSCSSYNPENPDSDNFVHLSTCLLVHLSTKKEMKSNF